MKAPDLKIPAGLLPAAFLVAAGSALPALVCHLLRITLPVWLIWTQTVILAAALIAALRDPRLKPFKPLASAVLAAHIFTVWGNRLTLIPVWRSVFSGADQLAGFQEAVALKLIGAALIAIVLIAGLGSSGRALLKPGELYRRARGIGWLGIKDREIKWLRLALISGACIAGGTALLSILTVTGFGPLQNIQLWVSALPLLIPLAAANALAEGILYRNTIAAPLAGRIDDRLTAILAGFYFGAAHYAGIPGGLVGAAASGLLGWFMTRAMLETRGFLAAWIIHAMQDLVIFSLVMLLRR